MGMLVCLWFSIGSNKEDCWVRNNLFYGIWIEIKIDLLFVILFIKELLI